MSKVCGIRFHIQDKIYSFDQNGIVLRKGDKVVVETEQGVEMAEVVYADREVNKNPLDDTLKPIVRKANSVDLEKDIQYREKAKESLEYFRQAIDNYNLPMKPIDVHFSFDGSKMTFYFTSDSRVDFRELVKDLTRHFQKSVRLQQVGSRDVAREIGGIGMCGRELCCSKFLKEMESITTDMARCQQMSHRGSERISGACGRLLCCLSYEAEFYEKMSKMMPGLDAIVQTKKGPGRVVDSNILKQVVRVRLENNDELELAIKEIKWKK